MPGSSTAPRIRALLSAALLLPAVRAVPAALQEVSASEFEEHSGSKDRRPADGIFLQSEAPATAVLSGCHPAACT